MNDRNEIGKVTAWPARAGQPKLDMKCIHVISTILNLPNLARLFHTAVPNAQWVEMIDAFTKIKKLKYLSRELRSK